VCWEYRARLTRAVVGLPNDRRQQRFALNVTLAWVVERSCQFMTTAATESARRLAARRAASSRLESIGRSSADGRDSAKLVGSPGGSCVEPLDESALRR